MNWLRSLAPCALALLASCGSFDAIDLREFAAESEFELTANEAPQYAEPVSLVYTSVSGFYLFGSVPIISATMRDCLRKIVKRARKLGADGVANIEIIENPASFFTLESVWPFPWTAL